MRTKALGFVFLLSLVTIASFPFLLRHVRANGPTTVFCDLNATYTFRSSDCLIPYVEPGEICAQWH